MTIRDKWDKSLNKVNRVTISDQVYKILIHQIIKGDLEPGQEIDIEELTRIFQASRTPVREVLQRLQGEGLVVQDQKGKFHVVKLSLDEIEQICEIRKMLETFALKYSFEKIPREEVAENLKWMKEARKSLEAGDPDPFYQADTSFHYIIFKYANNRWLAQLSSQIRNLVEITRNLYTSMERYQWSLDEHILIAEAFLKVDKEQTVRELENHLDHVKEHIIASFKVNEKNTED